MKIQNGFIRSDDGVWHSLSHIRSFYIGGREEVGFRICLSYEFASERDFKNNTTSGAFMVIGKTFKTKEECEEELDNLMYEKSAL